MVVWRSPCFCFTLSSSSSSSLFLSSSLSLVVCRWLFILGCLSLALVDLRLRFCFVLLCFVLPCLALLCLAVFVPHPRCGVAKFNQPKLCSTLGLFLAHVPKPNVGVSPENPLSAQPVPSPGVTSENHWIAQPQSSLQFLRAVGEQAAAAGLRKSNNGFCL